MKKAVRKILSSDAFCVACIIIAACGLMGGLCVASSNGGSKELAEFVVCTQFFWVLPLIGATTIGKEGRK